MCAFFCKMFLLFKIFLSFSKSILAVFPQLTVRYTLNNRYCYNASLYNCQNNSCENVLNKISEISGEWCQMEEIYYGEVPDNDVHLVM